MRSKSSSRLSSTSIGWGTTTSARFLASRRNSIPSSDVLLRLGQELCPLAGSQYLWPNRFRAFIWNKLLVSPAQVVSPARATSRNPQLRTGPGPILPEPKVTVRSYVAMGKTSAVRQQKAMRARTRTIKNPRAASAVRRRPVLQATFGKRTGRLWGFLISRSRWNERATGQLPPVTRSQLFLDGLEVYSSTMCCIGRLGGVRTSKNA